MRRYLNRRHLPWIVMVILVLAGLTGGDCYAAARREVKIPDISGYRTLKCDFHMHTVFSDGRVWPTVRVEEAWREGLDVFAITDHIEYLPHKKDVRPEFNRPYEIARQSAKDKGLIIIRGAEITRDMPPGHLNAIFLKDVNPLDTKDWKDAVKAAVEQGAFVFWNHPGWTGQQPDGKSRWYPEHTELYEKGWMHGIEVVNESSYYPLAHKWALEKKLTIVGNSDVHNPTNLDYEFHKGVHRPMTLVFAKEKNAEAIKEALFAHRTAVYHENTLLGEEKYLRPIYDKSVEILNGEVTVKGKGKVNIRVHNSSEIDYELAADGIVEEISAPRSITLYGDRTVLLAIGGKLETLSGTRQIRIPYRVRNLLAVPDEGLRVELVIDVNFVAVEGNR